MGVKNDGSNNQTAENKAYGTGWQTCKMCGITDKAVAEDRCSDTARCARVREGLPLGPPMVIAPPVRFDLDEDEQGLVAAAVQRWEYNNDWDAALDEDSNRRIGWTNPEETKP